MMQGAHGADCCRWKDSLEALGPSVAVGGLYQPLSMTLLVCSHWAITYNRGPSWAMSQ